MSEAQKQKVIVNTFRQELAILLMAGTTIKGPMERAVKESRGRILKDLTIEQAELYHGAKNILAELARQLNNCDSLEMLAKVMQIVQGITQGSVVEYTEVKDRIVDEQQLN